jgi:hypothetical protein
MRNLLALVAFALVTFLSVGWYLDWYHITPKDSATAGHRSIEADINAKKIGADVHKGVTAVEQKVQRFLDKDGKPIRKTTSE